MLNETGATMEALHQMPAGGPVKGSLAETANDSR